jgi:hypothetical protein
VPLASALSDLERYFPEHGLDPSMDTIETPTGIEHRP